MEMMKKKVVVATALGLTSMVLGAACGYGPPTYEYDDESTMQSSADADNADAAENSTDDVEDNNTNNIENNTDNIEDDFYDVEPSCVYGPPSVF